MGAAGAVDVVGEPGLEAVESDVVDGALGRNGGRREGLRDHETRDGGRGGYDAEQQAGGSTHEGLREGWPVRSLTVTNKVGTNTLCVDYAYRVTRLRAARLASAA
jgi:hypothetical protein